LNVSEGSLKGAVKRWSSYRPRDEKTQLEVLGRGGRLRLMGHEVDAWPRAVSGYEGRRLHELKPFKRRKWAEKKSNLRVERHG